MEKKNETKRAIIDFLILTAIILIISLAINAFVRLVNGKQQGGTTPIEYTVRIGEVRDELADCISVGDEIVDSVGKYTIGRATEIKIYPTTAQKVGSKGLTAEKIDGYSDIYVTVSAMASVSETDVIIDGYNLKIGRIMYLRFPNFTAMCECVEINEVE